MSYTLLGGMPPPGACLPSCFALSYSLFHVILQTLDDHDPIRRPASTDLTEHPCSVGLFVFERRGSQQAHLTPETPCSK